MSIEVKELYSRILGEKVNEFDLPPPSFEIMQCEILEFDDIQESMIVKMPVLHSWLNPYKTMQGGMVMAAIDNAVGPLSMLVAPLNVTRNVESKLLKPISIELEYIYVKATLIERKKKRLIFEAIIYDKDDVIYNKATFTNWIIVKN